jgi:dynein heavy chain 2
MSSPDPRKEYIVQVIIAVLHIPRELFRSNPASNAQLEKFLDEPDLKLLQALERPDQEEEPSKRTVSLSTSFDNFVEDANELHFIKTSYEPITAENISRVTMISTLRASPVRSLFYALREVYVPLLVAGKENVNWNQSSNLEESLVPVLAQLDAGLQASLRRSVGAAHVAFDEQVFSGILVPEDEIGFWSDYKSQSNESRVNEICSYFKPLQRDFETIQQKTMPQLLEFMTNCVEALDSVWQADVNPVYRQDRMEHVLHVFGGAFGRLIQSRLNGVADQVWSSELSGVERTVREGAKVLAKWTELVDEKVNLLWPQVVRPKDQMWPPGQWQDEYVANLYNRINEVLDLRRQHSLLLELIPQHEVRGMQLDAVFEPFRGISAFSYNEYTVPRWEAAKQDYETKMAPVEKLVADKLRASLTRGNTNPGQVLVMCQKYRELFDRPAIAQALTNDREHLLSELEEYLYKVKSDFEMVEDLPPQENQSAEVISLLQLDALKAKVDSAQAPLEAFLRDLPKAPKLKEMCLSLRRDLKEAKTRMAKRWASNVSDLLDNRASGVALETAGKVMEFDAANNFCLKVNYSERLIQLVREARLVEQLNLTLPPKIKEAVASGQKYYRFAVQLKQVSHFYNHMSEDILPCQKLMVLQPAMHFDKLFNDSLKGRKKVEWDNLEELEDFTSKVRNGAENLRSVNRRLRRSQQMLQEECVELFQLSLVKQAEKWKQKVNEMKGIADKCVQQCGCNPDDAGPWKAHWDHQVQKAVQSQYLYGLESLSEDLPQQKVEIVVQSKQLRFKPPLEELRLHFYKEVRNFLSWPLSFTGLEGAPQIFKKIPEKNQSALTIVVEKAETLFSRLQGILKQFQPWCILGFAEQTLQDEIDALETVEDFEVNFRMVRTKRKELDRLPEVIKVDCFTVTTTLVKSYADGTLEMFSDSLTLALKW